MKKFFVFILIPIALTSFGSHHHQNPTTIRISNGIDADTTNNAKPYTWDGKGAYNGGYDAHPSRLTTAEADRRAADIMQRTGNWSFVEPYLSYLSKEGTIRVENIYSSKGGKLGSNSRSTANAQASEKNYSHQEADFRATTIMKNSGTWGPEIDFLIPQMTPEAVNSVVSIYLERQLFPGITQPDGAKRVLSTIEHALKYMNENDKKAAEDRFSAYY